MCSPSPKIIFERVYIRRRWWQNQRPFPPPGENPGENQKPNFPDNYNPEGARNFVPIENEGNFKLDLAKK